MSVSKEKGSVFGRTIPDAAADVDGNGRTRRCIGYDKCAENSRGTAGTGGIVLS